MSSIFKVLGPFEVSSYEGKAARVITPNDAKVFWEENPSVAGLRGCYIFGIRAGKGYTPAWVGKATKTFKQEVFTSHKLSKYQICLADYLKGTPILLFITPETKKGPPNSRIISKLESFLINAAYIANPELLNTQGIEEEQWQIVGIDTGKAGNAAKVLKKVLKMF